MNHLIIKTSKEINGKKASEVDEVTKAEYVENLEANAKDLVSRMKRQGYKPQLGLLGFRRT